MSYFCKSILIISISLFLFMYCSQQQESYNLSGPYLGQNPPGDSAEIFAPGIISTGVHEMSITMTPDIKKIYWSCSGFDWFSDILMVEEMDGIWSKPKLADYKIYPNDNYGYISGNGKYLVFNSFREVGSANIRESDTSNIFYCELKNSKWSEPIAFDNNVNAMHNETYPAISDNGNIYFYSKRDDSFGSFDIYMCKKTDQGYSEAINLGPSINSEYYEFHHYIAPDESYIIFNSNRPEGYGRNDLYVSFKRVDGSWTKAKNLGKRVNTEYSDMRPFVSPDNRYLFFCSDRSNPGIELTSENLSHEHFMNRINSAGNGSQDIYWISADIIEEMRISEK